MATVINQVPQPNIGASLGAGVGAQLMTELKRQEQKEEMAKFAAFNEGMRNAGSRERGSEVLSRAMQTGIFKDPHDVAAGFSVLDHYYPTKNDNPHQITVYDQAGNPNQRFLKSGDLDKMNDPQFIEQAFGPGMSVNNPGEKSGYVKPGTVGPEGADGSPGQETDAQFLGKFTAKDAPPGSVTMQANEFSRQVTADKRAEGRASLATDAAARASESQAVRDRVETRRAGAEERRVAHEGTDLAMRKKAALKANMEDVQKGLMAVYGNKQLPDGTMGFDDGNSRDQYKKALNIGYDLVRKGHDHGEAVTQALDAMDKEKPKQEAPVTKTEPKKSEGFLSSTKKVLGLDAESKVKAKLKADGVDYEPDKYDYQIAPNGQVQRSLKEKKK